MFRFVVFVCAIIFLSACTTTQFSPAVSGQHLSAVVSANEVRVYSRETSLRYKEIGALHYKGASDLPIVMKALKEKAASEGGNAIIDVKILAGGVIATLVLIEE